MLYWASDMATPSLEGQFVMVHGSNKAPSPSIYDSVSMAHFTKSLSAK